MENEAEQTAAREVPDFGDTIYFQDRCPICNRWIIYMYVPSIHKVEQFHCYACDKTFVWRQGARCAVEVPE